MNVFENAMTVIIFIIFKLKFKNIEISKIY